MFWTDHEIQTTFLDGGYDVNTDDRISALINAFKEKYPSEEPNFWRFAAWLTIKPTQDFLRPILALKYKDIHEARVPVLEWLYGAGSFESYARATRNGRASNGGCSKIRERLMPVWYTEYLKTARFESMRAKAETAWKSWRPTISCVVNSRHVFEHWHHNDYGRLGCEDEYWSLYPYCEECHTHLRVKGPALSSSCPETVQKWL
jgi:hypothetical protein